MVNTQASRAGDVDAGVANSARSASGVSAESWLQRTPEISIL